MSQLLRRLTKLFEQRRPDQIVRWASCRNDIIKVHHMTFHCDKMVRFQHCDPAGIVFYPQYFVMFHEVLEDWFNDGLDVEYASFIATRRLGIPTVGIRAEFIAPSRHGETLRFALRVREIGRSSIKLGITASVRAELRANVEQTVVLYSLDDRRAEAVPTELRQKMLQFSTHE